jgi:hypothetical protein
MAKVLSLMFFFSATVFALFANAEPSSPPQQQEWFPNPGFYWPVQDEKREECFRTELTAQWPQAQGQTLSFGVPLPSGIGDRFARVEYLFCMENVDIAQKCTQPYRVWLETADKYGWEIDWSQSDNEKFFVKAKNLGRYATIVDKNLEPAGMMDLKACVSYFGIE